MVSLFEASSDIARLADVIHFVGSSVARYLCGDSPMLKFGGEADVSQDDPRLRALDAQGERDFDGTAALLNRNAVLQDTQEYPFSTTKPLTISDPAMFAHVLSFFSSNPNVQP